MVKLAKNKLFRLRNRTGSHYEEHFIMYVLVFAIVVLHSNCTSCTNSRSH